MHHDQLSLIDEAADLDIRNDLLWQDLYGDLPDLTLSPFSDPALRSLVDDLVSRTIYNRSGDSDDPGAPLSVLVSLIAEANSRLPDAVTCARDHHYSWDLIAERLGCPASAARRRYSHLVKLCRRHPPQPTPR